jgi:NAD dependent epimerase/dehydratase family enzyme
MNRYTETLADVLDRSARLRVPASVLRGLLGEVAEEMMLKSARVVPDRLANDGYTFGYADLTEALRHLLGRTDAPHGLGSSAPRAPSARR